MDKQERIVHLALSQKGAKDLLACMEGLIEKYDSEGFYEAIRDDLKEQIEPPKKRKPKK